MLPKLDHPLLVSNLTLGSPPTAGITPKRLETYLSLGFTSYKDWITPPLIYIRMAFFRGGVIQKNAGTTDRPTPTRLDSFPSRSRRLDCPLPPGRENTPPSSGMLPYPQITPLVLGYLTPRPINRKISRCRPGCSLTPGSPPLSHGITPTRLTPSRLGQPRPNRPPPIASPLPLGFSFLRKDFLPHGRTQHPTARELPPLRTGVTPYVVVDCGIREGVTNWRTVYSIRLGAIRGGNALTGICYFPRGFGAIPCARVLRGGLW
jgi:hypothetical protein